MGRVHGDKSSICYLNNRTNIKQTTRMKFIFAIIATIIVAAMAQNQEGGPQPDADAEAGTRYFGYGYDTMDTQSWEVDIITPTMAMLMLATYTTPDMVDTDHMDVMDTDVSSETERTRFC